MKRYVFIAVWVGLVAAATAEVTNTAIDWNQARRLNQRHERGEQLTDEELATLQAALEERARRTGEGAPPPTNIFTNTVRPVSHFIPLTALPQGETYKGEDGGLYGRGRNDPPPDLEAAAKRALSEVAPRDIDGQPDKAGLIVLLSIGMSNTTQEFASFKQLADADRGKSDAVVIVDGAQGGRDAASWDPANPVSLDVWRDVERRLKMAGVTPPQVQVVWIKQARSNPRALGEFPEHADALGENLIAILQEARRRFPNLRLAYLSSRTYAGYAKTQLSPEPYAYESAFAVRGVILAQLRGDKRLNADPEAGQVMAPVVLWGPYLWADGATPVAADGLKWEPEDVARDGVHPSERGREKVARLLLEFFRTHPLAQPWFTGHGLEVKPIELPEARPPAPENGL